MAISLTKDSNDKVALASMQGLVHSLMNNSPADAGEALRNHLLVDTAFKLRQWKPVDMEHSD